LGTHPVGKGVSLSLSLCLRSPSRASQRASANWWDPLPSARQTHARHTRAHLGFSPSQSVCGGRCPAAGSKLPDPGSSHSRSKTCRRPPPKPKSAVAISSPSRLRGRCAPRALSFYTSVAVPTGSASHETECSRREARRATPASGHADTEARRGAWHDGVCHLPSPFGGVEGSPETRRGDGGRGKRTRAADADADAPRPTRKKEKEKKKILRHIWSTLPFPGRERLSRPSSSVHPPVRLPLHPSSSLPFFSPGCKHFRSSCQTTGGGVYLILLSPPRQRERSAGRSVGRSVGRSRSTWTRATLAVVQDSMALSFSTFSLSARQAAGFCLSDPVLQPRIPGPPLVAAQP